MNCATIAMEKDSALAKLEQYEQAARDNPRAFAQVDRGIMLAYRALAKGRRVIDVNEAIKNGGLNLAGQPKLAIARANAQHTEFRKGSSSCFKWLPDGVSWWNSRHEGTRWTWRLPADTFDTQRVSEKHVRAMTPLIPLPLRPKFKLENYFLLWEANWHPAPPRDPYLLKPLAGSLMEIIAEWELSDLEIAAVRGAMQRT